VSVPDAEIVSGDPGEEDGSPPLVGTRAVETVTLAILLAFAALMAWDNWRTGITWESTGPKAGYFPFYLSVILAAACVYGLAMEALARVPAKPFVTRNQFKRVLQVFLPSLAYVPLIQWLGLYVASFLLIAGFMIFVGRLKPWVSLLTAVVFAGGMFVIFDVAFDVIMPKGPLEQLLGR